MYPASFGYFAPASLDDTLALMAEHGESAKLLAGGHSLIPMMKLRTSRPAQLIDLRRIAGLADINRSADGITIGSMATYASLLASEDVRDAAPMLAECLLKVGDPQVRNRGTIGGSIVNADPAADLPAVMLALDAQMTVVGSKGSRVIDAADFFVGSMQTSIASNEILTEIRVPASAGNSGCAYIKRRHPASRFALVGVAAVIQLSSGKIEKARIAVTGMNTHAIRAASAEQMLVGQEPTTENIGIAAASAASAVNPRADLQGDVEYKRHLTSVHVERALMTAVRRATS